MFKPGIIQYPTALVDFHTKAIDFNGTNEYMLNNTPQSIGVANSWTISCWADFATTGGFDILTFITPSTSTRTSAIYLYKDNAEKFTVRIYNSSATEIKRYITSGTVGGKVHLACSWDGTNLKLYVDGTDVTSTVTKTIDSSGIMTDSNRKIYLGSDVGSYMDGNISRQDLWNTVLGASSISSIYNSGNGYKLDLRNSIGSYTQNSNLKHQWALGKDIGVNIGADYVSSGGINVSNNSVNISDADIVTF